MSFMSDVDVRRALGRDLVIDPIEDDSVTPVGYDLRIGDFVYSAEHGLLQPENGDYVLPARATVHMLTKESVWLSNRIAGTVHSRVLLVSRGLSHISTTLDPLWGGPLLLTCYNNSSVPIRVPESAAIATVVFHRLSSPTSNRHREFTFIKRIILEQFSATSATQRWYETDTERFIKHVSSIIARPEIGDAFALKVHEANKSMHLRIAESIKALRWRQLGLWVWTLALWVLLFAVGSLHTYWDSVKPFVGNVTYDSKIFAGQLAALIALIAILRPGPLR